MKDITLRLVVALSGILLALIITEIVLRVFLPEKTTSKLVGPYTFPCYKKGTHSYVQLEKNKNCTLISNYSAFPDNEIRTNSIGIRNRDIVSQKPTGSTRVLFLGDSFTMGVGVTEAQAYPRIVEKLLASRLKGKTIETINAGINATGPFHQFVFLKHEGLVLDPDVVIVGFFPWNDISYDVYASERVTARDKDGFPDRVDSRTTYVDTDGSMRSKKLPLRFRIPFLRSLHTYWVVINALSPVKNQRDSEFTTTATDCLYTIRCAELNEAKKKTKELFLSYKKLTAQKNVKLLVVVIPTEFQIDQASYRKYALPAPVLRARSALPHNEFSAFFEKNKIDYIDLLPYFLNSATQQAYFDKDPHWNAYGHKLAANAVAKKLVASFLTAPASPSAELPN